MSDPTQFGVSAFLTRNRTAARHSSSAACGQGTRTDQAGRGAVSEHEHSNW